MLIKGVRPEGISSILIELHSQEYFEQWVEYEQIFKRKQSTLDKDKYKDLPMFSEFGDKTKII